jgi:dihydroorotate dehydrogenase (fumarate)
MDLSTTYLGFDLPHPLMPGASPMVDDLDTVKRLEDAGAAAIVMHSLFEEQIDQEDASTLDQTEALTNAHVEARSYLPPPSAFRLGPHEYLEQLRRIKETVRVPVIASLNGASPGGWLRYARLMEEAGADALELNVYMLRTDPTEDAATIEAQTVTIVQQVRGGVGIPVAVKLSPFYTALAHLAHRLDDAGAAGLVLFNRFWQPGIDVEELEVRRELRLSDPSELPLRLRWLAVLHGTVKTSLAAAGGVHGVVEAVQAIMAGADAVQVVSVLLRRGPSHLAELRRELAEWLERHEYESLAQMKGSMSLRTCPDPLAYERANYLMALQSWRPPAGWGTASPAPAS